MHVGEEIRRRREEQGLTGGQLAARAGMAPSAVSQIETGKRTPHSSSVIKLAGALGCEVGELYPKAPQPSLPLELDARPAGEAYFVPLKEGEEEETVELRVYYVRLLEERDELLQKMRRLEQENETLRERVGRASA